MTRRLDAHVHLLQPHLTYPWITGPYAGLGRGYPSSDLQHELRRTRLDGAIAVQALADETETAALLQCAVADSPVQGVVGWTDLAVPTVDASIERLRSLPGGMHLVGLRHQAHDEPDATWLSRPDVVRNLRAVARAGLTFDLLVRQRELSSALVLARNVPDLRLVIDHAAKPRIGTDSPAYWAQMLAPLAQCPNVWCKVSGLITEAEWGRWSASEIAPYLTIALELFGADRCIYGSDWPVCLLSGTYEQVYELAESVFEDLSPDEQSAVFGGSAEAAYAMPPAIPADQGDHHG
jgi:L-fuconolactonase